MPKFANQQHIKKRRCEVAPWRPHKLRLFSPLLTPLFRDSMLSQSLVIPTSLARLFINPEFCQCPLMRLCQFSYFDTCSRLRASVASACNWAGYRTFNVMVLKCIYYITRIALNVSQTGCSVASHLGIKPDSLVQRAVSLPTKPSEPAATY